jgi:predicted Rossmann fold nucleotide-binding protein DprA/Smf involved in DNA uptake
MSQDPLTIIESSTHLFNADFVDQEDRVYAVVWAEDGTIVAEDGSKRAVFFNLEENEEFEKKGIVFRPKNHRAGRKGNKHYITVNEVLFEFDEELLDEISAQSNDDKTQDSDSEDETRNKNVYQNHKAVSVTSNDTDLMSDIDVHKL